MRLRCGADRARATFPVPMRQGHVMFGNRADSCPSASRPAASWPRAKTFTGVSRRWRDRRATGGRCSRSGSRSVRLRAKKSAWCNPTIRRNNIASTSQKSVRVSGADAADSGCGGLQAQRQRMVAVDHQCVRIPSALMNAPSEHRSPASACRSSRACASHPPLSRPTGVPGRADRWRPQPAAHSIARSDCDGRQSVWSILRASARLGSWSGLLSI